MNCGLRRKPPFTLAKQDRVSGEPVAGARNIVPLRDQENEIPHLVRQTDHERTPQGMVMIVTLAIHNAGLLRHHAEDRERGSSESL